MTKPYPTAYYFAYGSNISSMQMRTRCPDSIFNGIGYLKDYDFLINERGVATIIPREGSIVYGLVWEVSPKDIESLDIYEGVRQGLYVRKNDICININPEKILAFIYVSDNLAIGVPTCSTTSRKAPNFCERKGSTRLSWSAASIFGMSELECMRQLATPRASPETERASVAFT